MISVVFPFYNEADRIHNFIKGLNQYQNRNKLINEIILVNDGSTDETISMLYAIQKQFHYLNIQIINYSKNKGKGHALRSGIMQTKNKWILCNDADLSYSFEQIDEWYEKKLINFNTQHTVYFGKRILNDKKSQFFIHRVILGKVYYFMIRLLLRINIKDTQCGFKLYETNIAKDIFINLNELRFAFDLEIIAKLEKNNYNIILLPVKCIEVEGSKLNLLKDSINMLFALFRIRKSMCIGF